LDHIVLGLGLTTREKYLILSQQVWEQLCFLPAGSSEDLITEAFSCTSWKRMSAALNRVKRFAADSVTTVPLSWPFTEETINKDVM
jgi:hypothetical protein